MPAESLSFRNRLSHAWNAFRNRDPTQELTTWLGPGSTDRLDRTTRRMGHDRSIIAAIYNRIAIDVSSNLIQHVQLDDNGRFTDVIKDELNSVLCESSNIDQTPADLIHDLTMSLFDEGAVALVPVDTTSDPYLTGSYDIHELRVGQILEWYPQHVKVRVYDQRDGLKKEIIVEKRLVAIVNNPFYAVMNEPNSTLRRLLRKLNLLDAIDEQSGSGKLDLIIQMPFVLKSPQQRAQAARRKRDIENQLAGSQYGIAYTDATERVIQLNRPADNNLMTQIEYLTNTLYSQLGLTPDVFNGTASEATMLNYNTRTVNVILRAIIDEMKRKFLTKNARSRNQSIMFFHDPFALVTASDLANIADKFTRNEVLSSNEVRAIIGFKPSKDPRADELRNKNLKATNDQLSDDPKGITEEEMKRAAGLDNLPANLQHILRTAITSSMDTEEAASWLFGQNGSVRAKEDLRNLRKEKTNVR